MIRKLLLLFVWAICAASSARAGDVPYTTIKKGSKDEIAVGAIAAVQDSVFFDQSLKPAIQSTNSVLNVIQLRIDEFSSAVLPDSFRVSIKLDITYKPISNSSTEFQIHDSVLVIDYNKYKAYTAKDYIYFHNAVYASIEIKSIHVDYAAQEQVLKVLELENEILVDRDFNMTCTAATVTGITNTFQGDEVVASWMPNRAAEAYDLEWTYIDTSALASGIYNNNQSQPDPAIIFKNNATRVSVTASSYRIPFLYEGSGQLFFRVRSVQYEPNGERKTASWSSDFTVGHGLYIPQAGHEPHLNWQSAVSFAEEGKRKAVVQYFDGALYNRQTVTKDNTTDTTLIAETLYDKQGRPAIQVLPAPGLSTLLKYTPQFNTLNTAEYDKEAYDPSQKTCDMAAPAMSVVSGAAQYYSPSNPQAAAQFHKYIPNADGFAFAETEYTNDNTGRIAKQGGVGKDHQLTSGHETRYFYGTPAQRELDALFGTEAGIASHYQKNMVRDANGQYSVSYVDMSGKTVATALAGKKPANLSTLPSNIIRTGTDVLLDASNNVVKGTVIESTKSILVPFPDAFTFSYQLDPQSLGLLDNNAQPICYDCLYDLEITITDDCNNGHLPGAVPYVVSKNNFSLGSLNTTCSPTAAALALQFSITLPEGSYNIIKRLRLSEQKMKDYHDSVFVARHTLRTYQDFYREAMDSVLHRAGDCTNDSTATLIYKSYREQMLQDLTAPYGQYAHPDPATGCSLFSIFSVYTQVAAPYRNDEGNIDTVYVMRDGEEVPKRPNELTREEFIAYFKPSWAESLLKYHPEYCLFSKYEKLAASDNWDADFENTNTFAEALAKGYLNPTGTTSEPVAGKFLIGKIDSVFFALNANGYSAQGSEARTRLNAFLHNVSTDPNHPITAWGYATVGAKCTETSAGQLAASCQQWASDANAFNPSMLCTGELDMAWRIFRGLYLNKKREWIDGFIRSGCSNPTFDYAQNPEAETPPPCTPVFPKRDEILKAGGLDFSNINQYQEAQQRGQQQLAEFYDNTCKGYATYWLDQLANCNYSDADKAAIIPMLVAVCKEGSDIDHPMGASSVPPSSTNAYRSFDDVIKSYNAAHQISYSSACNGYVIDAPKAWEGTTILSVNRPVYGKPDSCTCSRISQLSMEYRLFGSAYPTFSNYLAVRYHTNIAQEELDELIGMCSGTIACKYSEHPITIPPILQCTANTCASCTLVDTLYQEYTEKFKDDLPALLTAEDEVQEAKNLLFERFMNNHLGFAKPYYVYLNFLQSCQAKPVSSCDTSWTLFNPGASLYISDDLYENAHNNVGPYSQHFDGQHFVAPSVSPPDHYVLVNKKVAIDAGTDSLLTVKWRVQLSDKRDYINTIAKTTGAGVHSWIGATWQPDPADTTWLIGTTLLNGVGAINKVTGIGLTANSHTVKADWVHVYDSRNQLIYYDEFQATCQATDTGDHLCKDPELQNLASIEPDSPCADSAFLATIAATDRYRAYKDSLDDIFYNLYSQRCLSIGSLERFTVTHQVQEYHYTLYYYDQAGNLVKTVPPEGVDDGVYNESGYFEAVETARTAGTWKGPHHNLVTTYRYNSLNQVVSQQSPDGGLSQFWYDRLGRLVVSQNARQRAENNYSYTIYDLLGRIQEVGQKQQTAVMSQTTSRNAGLLGDWIYNGSPFEQVTRTVYDEVAILPLPDNSTAASFQQKGYTLRNRVSHTLFYDALGLDIAKKPLYENYTSGTFYSYDIHGNVDVLLQDYRQGMMAQHGVNRFKLTAYKYDLISGKVNEVHYQPGEADQLYHRYEYDAENRLTDVYTSFKKEFVGHRNLEDHEAFYQYYKHGPLARTILGQQKVQGLDYAYTLQGWLKGVNLDSTLDDNATGRDAYSFSLHYYNGDYAAISSNTPVLVNASGNAEFKPLYNGNIGAMAVNIKKFDKPLVYNYGYDQLNRLVSMDAFKGWNPANNIFAPEKTQDYKERVSYDANGNILDYERNGEATSSGLQMDKLTYQYERTRDGRLFSNRLRYVQDDVTSNEYSGDLKSQTSLTKAQVLEDKNALQSSDNFGYDLIGNLTKDAKEGINSIEWTVYGKIKSITKANGTTINYSYDASGNRISKTVTASGKTTTTWYVRDAQGNTMAVYNTTQDSPLLLQEQSLYGSRRLGVWSRGVNMDAAQGTPNQAAELGALNTAVFSRGQRQYELSNHLGNVLVTVSDKKMVVPSASNPALIDHYVADITTAQDYYPFGMLMPGRSGFSTPGGWGTGGTTSTGLPNSLTLDRRVTGTPEYKAGQSIEFASGFESSIGDEFIASISSGQTGGSGGTINGTDGVEGRYRYGFNGKENDNEVKGEGNQQDYGMRIYDPRLGKFLSVDPLTKSYPELTPYQFASNKPINSIDLDGGESKEVYIWYDVTGNPSYATVDVQDPYKLGDGTLYHIYRVKEVSWKQISKQSIEVHQMTMEDHVYRPSPKNWYQKLIDMVNSNTPQAIVFGSEHSSDYSLAVRKFNPDKPISILDYGAAAEIFALLPTFSEAGKPAEMPTIETIADNLSKKIDEAVQKEHENNPNNKNAADYVQQRQKEKIVKAEVVYCRTCADGNYKVNKKDSTVSAEKTKAPAKDTVEIHF